MPPALHSLFQRRFLQHGLEAHPSVMKKDLSVLIPNVLNDVVFSDCCCGHVMPHLRQVGHAQLVICK